MAGAEEDVVGLDVAVHDAVKVGVCQRVSDFAKNVQRIVERKHMLAVQSLAQRFPFDEGHRVIRHTVHVSRREDGYNVRVL